MRSVGEAYWPQVTYGSSILKDEVTMLPLEKKRKYQRDLKEGLRRWNNFANEYW